MAELPEIYKYTQQMDETLKGKCIENIIIIQEKCTNLPPETIAERFQGKVINSITYRGKWFLFSLSGNENIALSFGMGADILYHETQDGKQKKFQVEINFSDETGFTVRFWWFGNIFFLSDGELAEHKQLKDIAIDPYHLNFTLEYFKNLLTGKRTQTKSFLLNQRNIGGIGNMYMHDILFSAGIHPKTKLSDLSEGELENLYHSIMKVVKFSTDKGSSAVEGDFFGIKGGYGLDDILVGYRENSPCPVCGTAISLIKTGSTSSYICNHCQPLK